MWLCRCKFIGHVVERSVDSLMTSDSLSAKADNDHILVWINANNFYIIGSDHAEKSVAGQPTESGEPIKNIPKPILILLNAPSQSTLNIFSSDIIILLRASAQTCFTPQRSFRFLGFHCCGNWHSQHKKASFFGGVLNRFLIIVNHGAVKWNTALTVNETSKYVIMPIYYMAVWAALLVQI